MINFTDLKNIIIKNNNFIITCHVNPDADAIGSEFAMYYILQKLNKSARIINYSKTPENLVFLDKDNVIEVYEKNKHDDVILNSNVVIFLDMNAISRTKSMADVFTKFNKIKVVIDHHEYPEDITENIISLTDRCATGEIIYEFITETKICEIDYKIAYALYAAIMTDTGSFRYDRTTAKTHKIAAEFLELGVNPNEVYTEIYEKSNLGRIKLLGLMLSELKLNSTKEICYFIISYKLLKRYDVDESEIDGFVNNTLIIKGVKVGLLFLELVDGFKVSLRSKGKIPINLVAKNFGGGGHLNAAGIRMVNKKIEDYLPLIIQEVEEIIKKSGE